MLINQVSRWGIEIEFALDKGRDSCELWTRAHNTLFKVLYYAMGLTTDCVRRLSFSNIEWRIVSISGNTTQDWEVLGCNCCHLCVLILSSSTGGGYHSPLLRLLFSALGTYALGCQLRVKKSAARWGVDLDVCIGIVHHVRSSSLFSLIMCTRNLKPLTFRGVPVQVWPRAPFNTLL